MDETYLHWLMRDEFGVEASDTDVPSWYAAAACADRPDVSWFPSKGRQGTDAIAVCGECPVREQCLQHALQLEDGCSYTHRAGIWGGMRPRERAELARQAAA